MPWGIGIQTGYLFSYNHNEVTIVIKGNEDLFCNKFKAISI